MCAVQTVRWHERRVQLTGSPQRRPGTLRVVGSQPGKALSLVSSLSGKACGGEDVEPSRLA